MREVEISAWAVCRLPYTEEPVLFVQTEGEVETLFSLDALNGREGFLMAPFETDAQLPILLIRRDRIFRGWKEIESYPLFIDHPMVESVSFLSDENGGEAASENPEEDLQKEATDYRHSFDTFIDALHKGCFHKLVLSRKQTRSLPRNFSPWQAFREACRRYPRMMVYLCYTPQAGLWIGSSPEILLSGRQTQWHTVALAGTMPLKNGVLPASWDLKNSMEQRYVSDYLRFSLQSIGTIDKENGPYAVQAGELSHLKTDFFFTLPSSSYLGNVLQLLHPTPAVCGLPKEEARKFILTHEKHPRRYYSGIIGWISPTASTELYVNLRCMEVSSLRRHPAEAPLHYAQFYAGGGLLSQSDFSSECQETEEKMQTMKVLCALPFPEKE